MAYEMFLLAVPDGADVEETGEALLVRLADGHEHAKLTAGGRTRAEDLARRLTAASPDLAPTGRGSPAVAFELRSRTGIEVSLADRFARFLVPFTHHGADAAEVFDQLFSLLCLAAEATGWQAYDPQEGEKIALDDTTRDSVLEIYLSVMDQLRPAGSPVPGPGVVPA